MDKGQLAVMAFLGVAFLVMAVVSYSDGSWREWTRKDRQ